MGVNRIFLFGFGALLGFSFFLMTSTFLGDYREYDNEGIATILKKELVTVSDGQLLNLDLELVRDTAKYNFNVIESETNKYRYEVGQKVKVIYAFIENGYNVKGIIKPNNSHITMYYIGFVLSFLVVLKCLHFFVFNWTEVVKLYSSINVVKE